MGVMSSERPGLSADIEFEERTEPYRRELLAHCYRMSGSPQEAQDLLQETMLRAWRSFDRYDPDLSAFRTWLYRIATNVCLTALEGRRRRPLPSGLGAAGEDPNVPLVPSFDTPWLEPMADAMLWSRAADPASSAVARGSVRLAFMAAVQFLPARQRATLLLRDVLGYPAVEVAEMLDSTPAAVNSALQRARATLGDAALDEDHIGERDDSSLWVTVERYVDAFERADIGALTRLLAEDVVLEMPPVPLWLRGRDMYGVFIGRAFAMRGTGWRMVPFGANGQPAVAAYNPAGDGSHVAHSVQLFDGLDEAISHTVAFQNPSLFELFHLPAVLP
jgi:RNA polymerase sigma-70 factor (ECF subfamily)